jgi:hypothetical protein
MKEMSHILKTVNDSYIATSINLTTKLPGILQKDALLTHGAGFSSIGECCQATQSFEESWSPKVYFILVHAVLFSPG